MRVLNLGCGYVKMEFEGAGSATEVVGVDLSPNSQADIVHDLNSVPYPLESDSFDRVIMQDVVEHLDNLITVMEEVHRVARNGATIYVRTPHYSSSYAYNDPTHIRFFGPFIFDAFDVDSPNRLYTSVQFRILKREIHFPKVWRMLGVARLANRYIDRYEQLFAFTFRALNMVFELEVVKQERPR